MGEARTVAVLALHVRQLRASRQRHEAAFRRGADAMACDAFRILMFAFSLQVSHGVRMRALRIDGALLRVA